MHSPYKGIHDDGHGQGLGITREFSGITKDLSEPLIFHKEKRLNSDVLLHTSRREDPMTYSIHLWNY